MARYTLALETDHDWTDVDICHAYATALEDRGASRGQSVLEWDNLSAAREAATWLASKCRADEASAVVVLRATHNGDATFTAPVPRRARYAVTDDAGHPYGIGHSPAAAWRDSLEMCAAAGDHDDADVWTCANGSGGRRGEVPAAGIRIDPIRLRWWTCCGRLATADEQHGGIRHECGHRYGEMVTARRWRQLSHGAVGPWRPNWREHGTLCSPCVCRREAVETPNGTPDLIYR